MTVDAASAAVRYTHDFWELAHVSAFVVRGARRIRADAPGHPTSCDVWHRCDVEWVAFRNPDGRVVLVAANFSAEPARFTLRRPDRKALSYVLPAASSTEPSVVTMVWR